MGVYLKHIESHRYLGVCFSFYRKINHDRDRGKIMRCVDKSIKPLLLLLECKIQYEKSQSFANHGYIVEHIMMSLEISKLPILELFLIFAI